MRSVTWLEEQRSTQMKYAKIRGPINSGICGGNINQVLVSLVQTDTTVIGYKWFQRKMGTWSVPILSLTRRSGIQGKNLQSHTGNRWLKVNIFIKPADWRNLFCTCTCISPLNIIRQETGHLQKAKLI